MPEDPLEDVFNLEDRFYQQGYRQGLQDGTEAGRTEGRSFGMQKGFEKFVESGRLASRAIVWANRIPPKGVPSGAATASSDRTEAANKGRCTLPPLPSNARLDKNVRLLYALVEPDTLSTENTDEAVQDFDDRVKRAQGKAKVVEHMVG
ncbi:multidrug resistance protein [Purpureocillium lavendulum]|uniref:Multidrug resistance protein n=1 Tax=Purpureocillium lavendulum TaxID=1247861 RepID=A0AB34FFN9_9HYPO|nr:multidrug resistance protein [Purpureocillium lavendulum]